MILTRLLLLAAGYIASSTVSALQIPPSFENTAVVRTVELGGSSVHVTTSFTARSLTNNNAKYYFAIPRGQDTHTSWVEAKIKGKGGPLPIERHYIEAFLHKSETVVYYSITLPKPLDVDSTITLLVSTIETHVSSPLPATAKQSDAQSLSYETGAYVQSPYVTLTQRTKIRSPHPTIHSYSQQDALSKFASVAPFTKSGAAITYGPFQNVPTTLDASSTEDLKETVKIHFVYDTPVLTVTRLKRTAEISHWGANLNIQDEIQLRNDGPTLQGHFSRLDHQHAVHYKRGTDHILQGFVLHLPAGIRDPYFTDIVGNVSTSRFRPASSTSKLRSPSGADRWSTLDVKPRYPLLGGWNYTFTLGWDAPLEDSARYDKAENKYVVAIPFFTHIPGSVVDNAEVKVIFPEGATNIRIHTPFAVDTIGRETHVTYLDTKGRPAFTFYKHDLTEKHIGLIYATYSLSVRAHLSKVVAVSTASFILFSLMFVLRRVDTTISKST